ncbi:MAG: hypothetical protein AB7J28_12505 [Hyphomonadaceae bacterium]
MRPLLLAAAIAGSLIVAPAAFAVQPNGQQTTNLPSTAVCTRIDFVGGGHYYRCTHNGNTWQCSGERTGCTLETTTLTAPRAGLRFRALRAHTAGVRR